MLFCSSVATAGSVIPAGGVSVNAACDDCNRFEIRSTTATAPAANRPEMMAINKIWRAESLYIRKSSLSNDDVWPKDQIVRCFRLNRSLCSETRSDQARTRQI